MGASRKLGVPYSEAPPMKLCSTITSLVEVTRGAVLYKERKSSTKEGIPPNGTLYFSRPWRLMLRNVHKHQVTRRMP